MTDATCVNASKIENHGTPIKANVKEDKFNICLLLVLYILQSVPIGFTMIIPLIIQNANYSSFNDQAIFSLSLWPFSLKLLWAPLVDSLSIKKLGRRKSWLIPVQYILGLFLLFTGFHINDWLFNASKPQINMLTIVFFILCFLAATQDIVVDGWALTLLKRKNISYASTCNCAGLSLGMFFGFILPITLGSKKFCNKWLRTVPLPEGVLTLKSCLYFWGTMSIIVTTLVAIFIVENDCSITGPNAINLKMIQTYKLLLRLIKLPNVKKLVIILFTMPISFCAVDSAFKLKLVDGGITKDEIGMIEFLIMIFKIFLPYITVTCTSADKSLINFFKLIVCRLICSPILTIIVYIAPHILVQTDNSHKIVYKVVLGSVYLLYESINFTMWMTVVSFFAKISDPKIGGTNMTLLTTVSHLGARGSRTIALWLHDFLTFQKCYDINTTGNNCQVFIDGFYIEVCICTIYGVIWCYIFKKSITILQLKNVNEWHLDIKKNNNII